MTNILNHFKIMENVPLMIFRNKGVKVELGIPMELWDEPSAEVAHLKTQVKCLKEKFGVTYAR